MLAGSLSGRRVLVCRAESESTELCAGLAALGAEVVAQPLILTAPPAQRRPLIDAAERWNRGDFDWLVVTSANGARAFADAGAEPRRASGAVPGRVAAVGPGTAAALRRLGFEVSLLPERDYSAHGLADALLAELRRAPSRLLLPLAELADGTVQGALDAVGHRTERVTAYRTVPVPGGEALAAMRIAVARGDFDAVLLLSASGAAEFARRIADPQAGSGQAPRLVAIGPPTAAALARVGLRADAVADPHSSQGLLAAVVALLAGPAAAVSPAPAVAAAAVPLAAATPSPETPETPEEPETPETPEGSHA